MERVAVEWLALWVILALAFALSFRALFDVGRAAGLGELAWALPVIVDGFAILAARVIDRLRSRWARLYPWTLLVVLVGVSAWWNALHAGGEVVLDPTVAAIVAGAPPVILGLAYHLLRMVTNTHHERDDQTWRAINGDGALTAPPQARTYLPVAQDHAPGAAQSNGDGRDVAAQDNNDQGARLVLVPAPTRAWFQSNRATTRRSGRHQPRQRAQTRCVVPTALAEHGIRLCRYTR
jgi:hypothetical protein